MAELGSLFKKKKKKSFKSTNLNALNKPTLAASIRTSIGGRNGLKVLGKKPTIRADAPKPVNLTSLRKEHNGLDIHVKLVGEGGGASEDSTNSKRGQASGYSQASAPPAKPPPSAAKLRWERSRQNPHGAVAGWGQEALTGDQQSSRTQQPESSRGRGQGPARAYRADRSGRRGDGSRVRFPDGERFSEGPGGFQLSDQPGHRGRNSYDNSSYIERRDDYGHSKGYRQDSGYTRHGNARPSGAEVNYGSRYYNAMEGYDTGRSGDNEHWADRGAPIRIDHDDPYSRQPYNAGQNLGHGRGLRNPLHVDEYDQQDRGADDRTSALSAPPSSTNLDSKRPTHLADASIDQNGQAASNPIPEYESRRMAAGSKKRMLYNPVTGEMEEVGEDNVDAGRSASGGHQSNKPRGSRDANARQSNKPNSARDLSGSQKQLPGPATPANFAPTARKESKLMEQLRKKKAEAGRRKQEKENRQRKEKAERKKKRKDERRSRGPRTRGIKFAFDGDSRLVNTDDHDPAAPAHETLQLMAMASSTTEDELLNPELDMDSARSPVGMTNLSDLTGNNDKDDVLVGGDTNSLSVWGSSPTSLSKETSPTSKNDAKDAVNKAWADSVHVLGSQGSSSTGIIGKPSSPTSTSPSSGSTMSTNPYADAFASSLQQPFVRAPDGDHDSGANIPRQRATAWGSSSGETGNLPDGNSADKQGLAASQWGNTSAGGRNPGASEFVPSRSSSLQQEEEPSPTMSPQFSAMRPASDRAEFNIVSFPASLMGGTVGSLNQGSRSLLGMQREGLLMMSNLQAPYKQWSNDVANGGNGNGFGYGQHQQALNSANQNSNLAADYAENPLNNDLSQQAPAHHQGEPPNIKSGQGSTKGKSQGHGGRGGRNGRSGRSVRGGRNGRSAQGRKGGGSRGNKGTGKSSDKDKDNGKGNSQASGKHSGKNRNQRPKAKHKANRKKGKKAGLDDSSSTKKE